MQNLLVMKNVNTTSINVKKNCKAAAAAALTCSSDTADIMLDQQATL